MEQSNEDFKYCLENVDSDKNYSYLLNFWYTSKINKEKGYIKRNGVHPKVTRVTGNSERLHVNGANGLHTTFYTAFRIFLTKFFDNCKVAKQRDQEVWKAIFKNDVYQLDNFTYLLFSYLYHEELSDQLTYPIRIQNRYSYRGRNNRMPLRQFEISLRNNEELHSKAIFDKLAELSGTANETIDTKIPVKLSSLLGKIGDYLPPSFHLEEVEELEEVDPNKQKIERLLIPTFRQVENDIRTLDRRAQFAYLLAYAEAMTNNPDIQTIENNDTNYAFFNELVNEAG